MEPDLTLNLWPDGAEANRQLDPAQPAVRLELFQPAAAATTPGPHPALLVCPGGGYRNLAPHEARPVAELAVRHGLAAAVVYYRVAPWRFPAAYADVARAIRLLRANAAAWNLDPDRIALLGFSAGGHLAASVATRPELHAAPEDALAGRVSARPDRLVLAYPVISLEHEHHEGSAVNLLGPSPDAASRRRLSLEHHVDANTPPTFLFHTADDATVPVSNSLRFAAALARAKIHFALHVFPHGPHGVGLAGNHPALRRWPELLADWLLAW
ncbi:MAG: alpha/beta hydrolase [Lentisphaeria bacterium]|jgi:acetyl esterase/lipase